MRLDECSGHVVVACSVNGQSVHMMLDTGACHTVLHKPVAESLPELQKKDGSADFPQGAFVSLAVAGKRVEKHPVLLLDLRQMRVGMKEKADGVLGMDILRNMDFTLDFMRGVFCWGLPEKMENLRELPGEYNDLGCFETELSLGDEKKAFLLDTGHARSIMKPADWPYDKENECAVQVADINTPRDREEAEGCPTDVMWAEPVQVKSFAPLLSSVCVQPVLGLDALRGLKLVHKAATLENPQGQFFVQQEAPLNK